CILSVKNNWSWLTKLMKCSETHLNHSSNYHQYYHTIKELRQWLPVDLEKANNLLNVAEMKKNLQGATVNKLLLEIKTALTIFLSWNSRLHQILLQSKQLVPVHLRTHKITQPRMAVSLAKYQTKNVKIEEGEEVIVQDNSRIETWEVVRNVRNEEFVIPSVILTIPGPDPEAVDAALKLTLEFLGIWTVMVKKYGRTIIWFLLQVIREWTPSEEKMLKNLSKKEKNEILHLLKSIEETFSRYWKSYKLYVALESRMEHLKKILIQRGDESISAEKGSLLVIQTVQLEDLLAKYREFWKNWEIFKVLNETMKHPECLLTVSNWHQYQYCDFEEWTRKWQLALEFDEDEFNEPVDEEIQVERAKETAEASQLYTSEQEENQTFIITGVMDTKSEEEISLDDAIEKGIINQTEGKYYDTKKRSSLPIPVAMSEGKIKVEKVDIKKSAEKVKDIGLITITVIKESRPYKLKGVIDTRNDQKLSVEEATKCGILDQKNSQYKDLVSGSVISLADALDSGLLIVEFQPINGNGSATALTKTYAVSAVVDMLNNQKYTFSEAVRAGLINADDGSYLDRRTNTNVYIGDAIKESYLKAIIVKNPKLLDINPANRISISEEKMNFFKQTLIKPLRALNALKIGVSE
ncbi:hypothetical protein HELRODRAFT_73191, partial [Helobdella robusta]|uniref:Desmoplakin SH3 domain-containing protein n=1 Tax=Helobdella robusta TaxID=6412 RepID=T1G1B5_HELRO